MASYLYFYRFKTIRVIDGDTIDAEIDLGFEIGIKKQRFRLTGIDTPERGEKGFQEATEALRNYLEVFPGDYYLESFKDKSDSFGRYLAELFTPQGESINMMMLNAGYAKPYNR